MGMKPDQVWEEEDRVYFRSAYGRFAKAFSMAHGDRLKLTEGDAFLVYIEVYGYDNVKGQTEREMYRAVVRIWEEIQPANRGNKIELIQDPQEVEEDKNQGHLKMVPASGRDTKRSESGIYLWKNSRNFPVDLWP